MKFPKEALVFQVTNHPETLAANDGQRLKVTIGTIVEFVGDSVDDEHGKEWKLNHGYFAARVVTDEGIVDDVESYIERSAQLLGFYGYQQGWGGVVALTPAARELSDAMQGVDDDEGKAGDQGD